MGESSVGERKNKIGGFRGDVGGEGKEGGFIDGLPSSGAVWPKVSVGGEGGLQSAEAEHNNALAVGAEALPARIP